MAWKTPATLGNVNLPDVCCIEATFKRDVSVVSGREHNMPVISYFLAHTNRSMARNTASLFGEYWFWHLKLSPDSEGLNTFVTRPTEAAIRKKGQEQCREIQIIMNVVVYLTTQRYVVSIRERYAPYITHNLGAWREAVSSGIQYPENNVTWKAWASLRHVE